MAHLALPSIHDAFIELSRRAATRAHKPVVKLILDRGSPKQVFRNHQRVAEAEWDALGLPSREQAPNIAFECMVRVSLLSRIHVPVSAPAAFYGIANCACF